MWRGISHIFCIKFFNVQLFLGFLFSLLEIPLLWDPCKTCIYIFKWLLLCNSDASQSRKKAAHLSCMWNAVSFRRKCSIGRGVVSVLPVEYKSSKDDSLRQCLQYTRPTTVEDSLIFGCLWLWCYLGCVFYAWSLAAVSLGSMSAVSWHLVQPYWTCNTVILSIKANP